MLFVSVAEEIENLFEKTMKENFPNLGKKIDIQIQEAQRVSNKMNPKRPTPRHIIIKTGAATMENSMEFLQ